MILRLIMMLTMTEEKMMRNIETRMKPRAFSIWGGKISQLKIVSASKMMAPKVTKPRKVMAREAVSCSILFLFMGWDYTKLALDDTEFCWVWCGGVIVQ